MTLINSKLALELLSAKFDGKGIVDYTDLSKNAGVKTAFTDIGSIVNKIVPYIFYGAGIILLLIIISGGLGLMSSGGDPKKVQLAQGKITSGIIGFIVIFAAYWIVQLVYKILGVEAVFTIFK